MVSNFYCRIIAFYMFFTFGHGFRIFFKRKDEEYYKFKLIFPGTKWCGTGNIAETFEDVGVGCSFETDKCCRDHDQCGDIIEAGQSKYNLINDSIFTRYIYGRCVQYELDNSKLPIYEWINGRTY